MSYIVPIGPYHPALEEPVHARLITEGEVIKDAEVFVGYNHRGIEKLATERNAIQTLVLVERVCGICSHSHAFTYAMAVEKINGIEVPKRGDYLRVITAELERLHSHFLWLGIACHIIGHDSMFMHIWDERELVMDILEKLTGNRVNYAMVTIGGSRRDVSDELRREILDACDKLKAHHRRQPPGRQRRAAPRDPGRLRQAEGPPGPHHRDRAYRQDHRPAHQGRGRSEERGRPASGRHRPPCPRLRRGHRRAPGRSLFRLRRL